jgi:hypothetical protein
MDSNERGPYVADLNYSVALSRLASRYCSDDVEISKRRVTIYVVCLVTLLSNFVRKSVCSSRDVKTGFLYAVGCVPSALRAAIRLQASITAWSCC